MLHFRWETFTKLIDPVIFSNSTGACFSHVFAPLGIYLLLLMGQTVIHYVDFCPNTLFSAVTDSKYLRKDIKREAFIRITHDVFPQRLVRSRLEILASSLHPDHYIK